MNKPITLFDRVLDALKSCEGALSSYVDGNTYPDMMACVAIRDHAQALIAEAEPANTLLPGTGNEPASLDEAIRQAVDGLVAEGLVEVEFEDETMPLPFAEALPTAVRLDATENGTHKPPTREYSVMLRRPTWEYARIEVDATDAKAAVEKGREQLGDENVDWERDDRSDPIDWISAENIDIDDEPDHAEWEEPKLSPGALMKALHKIVQLTTEPYYDVAIVKIRNTALRAIEDAVPFEKE